MILRRNKMIKFLSAT